MDRAGYTDVNIYALYAAVAAWTILEMRLGFKPREIKDLSIGCEGSIKTLFDFIDEKKKKKKKKKERGADFLLKTGFALFGSLSKRFI